MTTTTKTANGAAAADATTDGATTKKRGPAASLPAREEGHAGDWRDFRPALKDKLASAACWATGSSWLTACVSAMIPAHKLVGAPKIDWFSRFFCRGLVKTATWSSWRSVVHPAVSEDEQYIFAQNHINHFDFVSMYPATRHYKQGLELETHFRYPVYGPFMESRGTIPVPAERSERLPAIKKHIASEVAAGRSILAFPEGTTTTGGDVLPFKRGVFGLARLTGAPVVPVTLRYESTDPCWVGDEGFLPHYVRTTARSHTRVRVRFGRPLVARRGESAEGFAERARTVVRTGLVPGRAEAPLRAREPWTRP